MVRPVHMVPAWKYPAMSLLGLNAYAGKIDRFEDFEWC